MFSLKRLIKLGLTLALLSLLAIVALYFSMRDELPSVASLKNVQWQTPMQIYSNDAKLISQFGEKKRIPLTLAQMPQHLINAILATEDDRFYQHFGVDPIGLTRAIVGQIIGQNKGGGSTITMQVARNFFLTREQTYIRKLREIFTSFHIESLLSKDEILMLYMNKISLGHRAFGFGAAAQVYYGKDVKELTLAQIAVLAGLPKAPSNLNPIRSPSRAKSRRNVVLQRMLVSDYISNEEYLQASKAPITGKRHGAEIEIDAPYIAEMAHQEMISRYGKEQAYTGGYKVFTTVPANLQLAAQHALVSNLMNYDQRHGYRGPISSLSAAAVQDDAAPPALLTVEEIDKALAKVITYHPLVPAVVTQVDEQAVAIALSSTYSSKTSSIDRAQDSLIIDWPGLSWARQFISDKKQGDAPKSAAEILKVGDVIWVTRDLQGKYRLSQLPKASAALVSIAADDGAIKAAVGGFNYKQSQYNRVTQAKRQVGSNIKPFIYSAALDNGFTLASLVNDSPINQWDRSSGAHWRPKNSPPNYAGLIRIRSALAQSKNVISVRLLWHVGLDKIIDHLTSFGFIPDDLPRSDSLALGSASLTPLELAAGFATFANGGFLIQPYLIERIEDSFGQVVFQADPAVACDPCTAAQNTQDQLNSDKYNTPPEQFDAEQQRSQAQRAITPQNAFLVTEALKGVIWDHDWTAKPAWRGTGWRAQSLKRHDIAGKTGTTNDAKDAWFSGYSRRIVTTSWIGFDDYQRDLGRTRYNSNLGRDQVYLGEAGAKSAQPAWITFMKSALAQLPEEPFEPPENMVSVRIDKKTGSLSSKTDKSTIFEYFATGTEPTEYVVQDDSSEIFDGAAEPSEQEEIF